MFGEVLFWSIVLALFFLAPLLGGEDDPLDFGTYEQQKAEDEEAKGE